MVWLHGIWWYAKRMIQRSEGDLRPDWECIPEDELTAQQWLAKRTHGIVRLPNVMTAIGVGATIAAVRLAKQGRFGAAAAAGLVSAVMDADGAVARRNGVSDPRVGGLIDQGADAAKAVIVGGSLVANDVMPGDAAALAYIPKIAGALVGTGTKLMTGVELPSSMSGKAAEVARMTMPIGFLIESTGEKHHKQWLEKTGKAIGWTAAGAAFVLGSIATAGYVHEALKTKK